MSYRDGPPSFVRAWRSCERGFGLWACYSFAKCDKHFRTWGGSVVASQAFYLALGSREAYNDYLISQLSPPSAVERPVFRVLRYRSGEMTGAYWLSGAASKVTPPPRHDGIETTGFSVKSRQKIRRAVENSTVDLKVFMTLTFDPSALEPWHFAENGTIRHDYAKHRLIQLRQAITKMIVRKNRKKLADIPENEHQQYMEQNAFRYIWTAELHKNGNIHFHLLISHYLPIKWLSKLWKNGGLKPLSIDEINKSSSVDVKPLKDAEHAANYISKYVTKDEESTIKGNRYNISQALREDAKPMSSYRKEDDEAIAMRKLLTTIKDELENNGSTVIGGGFGVVFPRPRRSRVYRDKSGKTKKTRGIDRRVQDIFLDVAFPVPF